MDLRDFLCSESGRCDASIRHALFLFFSVLFLLMINEYSQPENSPGRFVSNERLPVFSEDAAEKEQSLSNDLYDYAQDPGWDFWERGKLAENIGFSKKDPASRPRS